MPDGDKTTGGFTPLDFRTVSMAGGPPASTADQRQAHAMEFIADRIGAIDQKLERLTRAVERLAERLAEP